MRLSRAEVSQATGMVRAQLEIDAAEDLVPSARHTVTRPARSAMTSLATSWDRGLRLEDGLMQHLKGTTLRRAKQGPSRKGATVTDVYS